MLQNYAGDYVAVSPSFLPQMDPKKRRIGLHMPNILHVREDTLYDPYILQKRRIGELAELTRINHNSGLRLPNIFYIKEDA